MSKPLFGSLILALTVFSVLAPPVAQANGTARSGPAVYISTAGGKQILAVDGETGNTVVIHTGASGFSPEDIVVGPDKRIYICDTANNKIYRMRQDNTQFETIYDRLTAPSGQKPAGPEGPSFNGNDLYFNTAAGRLSTGVWVITGAAAVAFGEFFNAPTHVLTTTASGEGTAFVAAGTTSAQLLTVEKPSNQVLSCSPSSCSSPTTLIQNPSPCGHASQPVCVLDSPVGIAVNIAGHIFVANRGSLKNINEFDSSGKFVRTYATFSGDSPYFLEFDAFDRLYVVTADNTFANGQVWRIDPGTTPTITSLVILAASGSILTTDAVGLGLAPGTFVEHQYSSTVTSNTFDFGTDQVVISFLGSINDPGFDLIVFREEIPPALLATQLTLNFPNASCTGYIADPGTCVVYEIFGESGQSTPPVPTDPPIRSSTTFSGDIQFHVFYSTSTTLDPVLAHAKDGSPNIQTPVDQYDEDIINAFSTLLTFLTPPGDPVMKGESGGFSRLAVLNKPLLNPNANSLCFQSPVPPGRIFNLGQTVPVKFEITTGPLCTGSFITTATMHLSVVQEGAGFQQVQSTAGSTTGDLFRIGGNQYVFNLDTKNYTAGHFFITVWGDGIGPQPTDFFLQ